MASTPVQNGYNNKDFVDKTTVNLPKHKQISVLEKHFAMPNGYKVSPKISPAPKAAVIDKASIDFHLENFIMNRKIALNGGNELRIDDKNISLHLNNAFVTTFAAQHSQQQQLRYDNTINGNFDNGSSLPRPKRPHSIAVEPQLQRIKSNDEKSNFHNAGDAIQREPLYNAFYSTIQKNSEHRSIASPISSLKTTKQEGDIYTSPVPGTTHSNSMVPPAVPQRRSQSIPRQNATNGSNTPPVLRPRSLDRNTPLAQQPIVPIKRMSQPGLPNMRIPNGPGIRQSVTFHGQLLDQGVIYSNMNEIAAKNVGSIDRKQPRPVSFAYGTVPDQAFLEKQLRIYSEQLRTITESVKRYSEQAKLLQELKKQKQHQHQKNGNHSTTPMSKQHPTLQPLQTPPPGDVVNEEVQTPSHQLKLFLESIRSSMREPEMNDESYDDGEDEEEGNAITETVDSDKTPTNTDNFRKEPSGDAKTPSDQLRQFLDAIRSNQPEASKTDLKHSSNNNVQLKSLDNATTINARATVNELDAKNKSIEKLIDSSVEPKNVLKPFDAENQEKLAINIAKTSKTVDQILDKFHLLAMNAKSADSVEYLKKCSDALKQTSEQIRLFNMAYGGSNGSSFNGTGVCTNSSDDSSCSTTPGSIREAVQSLLTQPRNGFQIMDDRMALFIDILDTQDKFSQVIFDYL